METSYGVYKFNFTQSVKQKQLLLRYRTCIFFDSSASSKTRREKYCHTAKILPPQTTETIQKLKYSDKVDAKKRITGLE